MSTVKTVAGDLAETIGGSATLLALIAMCTYMTFARSTPWAMLVLGGACLASLTGEAVATRRIRRRRGVVHEPTAAERGMVPRE